MPIKFSEQYSISQDKIEELKVFDVIIDVDTRVFLDPALLKLTAVPEFEYARDKIEKYFSNIITLLKHTKNNGDMYWKKADSLLKFKELSGTCFGYTQNGTGGNAIGKVLRGSILLTIKELITSGESDPILFELLGVFQERVGCDRISDLITFILKNEIFAYTERVLRTLNIECITAKYDANTTYFTCLNPYNNTPLLLLPAEILSPLPVVDCFDDIDFICGENQRVRDEINAYFDLEGRSKLHKSDILNYMHSNENFRKSLLSSYRNFPAEKYDFSLDPAGEYVWLDAAKKYAQTYPLDLTELVLSDNNDVKVITHKICTQFKQLIEINGLHDLLYDQDKKAKHERAAQLLFFGIADSYCLANNIDLTRESNSGRGPVDFKLSKSSLEKIVVEIKLTSNGQLKHGIEKQLPIYMKQENTINAIYLIIDNGHPKALENFYKFYNELSIPEKSKIDVIVIDGTYKKSASNA